MDLKTYIRENWKNTIRDTSSRGHGMVTMPKPFSSPSIETLFEDFYYWDTYFINLGLMVDGLHEQAKNNIDNMAFFIRHMGYMPNASHLHYSSQPPLFTRAVFDYYNFTKNEAVLTEYLDAILIEYNFYMKDRITEIGLNQYGYVNFLKSQSGWLYDYASKRLGVTKETEEEKLELLKTLFTICESGLDSAPCFDMPNERFAIRKFTQVALNSLLYDVEIKISTIYKILGDTENENKFLVLAENRKNLINKYMLNKENGIYYDYNFKDDYLSEVACTTAFYPYVVGISNDTSGLKALLNLLELPYGLSTCEYKEKDDYLQWDYPTMWAPQVYFAFEALQTNGLVEDAKRIALKYISTLEKVYEETGILWEKYNAKTCAVASTRESGAHPMLGWTGAIYQYLQSKI